MNEQTALVKSNGNSALAFANQDPAQVADRLALMIVGGKKLQRDECMALAAYAIATGLNPFAGECYYLPGIGPGPGIAGWRSKAEEQLEYEGRKANMPAARFWADYVEPDESEGSFDASKGDIGVKAILHDTITKTDWEKRTLGYYIDLVKNGLKDNAWEIASKLVGPEPTWSAVGVVRGDEKFAYDGKPEKMDRYERACKRAEKAAIRKRFPRVNLPEPAGWEQQDVIDVVAMDVPRPTEAQLMSELGFESEPEKQVLDPAWKEPEPQAEQQPASPYADLEFMANADPTSAFWALQRRIGMDKATAQAIVKECNNNFGAAFEALLKQAPK